MTTLEEIEMAMKITEKNGDKISTVLLPESYFNELFGSDKKIAKYKGVPFIKSLTVKEPKYLIDRSNRSENKN